MKITPNMLNDKLVNFKKIVEGHPDHIVILDKDLCMQYVNYPSPGLTLDDLIGKKLYTFATGQENEVKEVLKRVLATGKKESYETTYTQDNMTIYYESNVSPIYYENEVIGLNVSSRDITKMKQTAKENKVLRGLLSICSYCKKIQNEEGKWESIEAYIDERSEASFTHSMCEACYNKAIQHLHE